MAFRVSKVSSSLVELSGHMSQSWADQHEEEPSRPFYVSSRDKPRKCQNPSCGHVPIYNIWVMRHEESGDVKEIGTICHQRWKRLRGLATEPWFDEYEANLITIGGEQRGRKFTSTEMKTIQKDSRKKWIIKQVKKRLIPPLRVVHQPFENFKTREQVDQWAKEHGGYVFGDIWKHVRVGRDTRVYKIQTDTRETVKKHVWVIYVNPVYKGEY